MRGAIISFIATMFFLACAAFSAQFAAERRKKTKHDNTMAAVTAGYLAASAVVFILGLVLLMCGK